MGIGRLKGLAAIAAVAAMSLFGATASHAVTLNFLGQIGPDGKPPKEYFDSIVRASVTCDSCVGIDSSAVSNTVGDYPTAATLTGFAAGYSDLFVLGDSGTATELAFANQVAALNGDGPFATVPKTDGGGASVYSFTSTAEYILFKIGFDPNVTVIRNTSGKEQRYDFLQIGEGAGLSHISTFGSVCDPATQLCGPPVSRVPVPASLPLLLSALGAGVLINRRRRKSA